ncbi:MAG: FAD:protein FMN transferase, partial [Steroidobacteraceae bacterium]
NGVAHALVAIGGDIAVAAPPPGEAGWAVEVAALAVLGAPPHIGTLSLRDAAISTTGDAEQWMHVDGQCYSHVLDPRSGWPMTVRSSTTVVARRGIDADSLATAAAVLGPVDGLRLVERTSGAAAFMARQEGDGRVILYASPRWSEIVHLDIGPD